MIGIWKELFYKLKDLTVQNVNDIYIISIIFIKIIIRYRKIYFNDYSFLSHYHAISSWSFRCIVKVIIWIVVNRFKNLVMIYNGIPYMAFIVEIRLTYSNFNFISWSNLIKSWSVNRYTSLRIKSCGIFPIILRFWMNLKTRSRSNILTWL